MLSVQGPLWWNGLPASLRNQTTLEPFKLVLKFIYLMFTMNYDCIILCIILYSAFEVYLNDKCTISS